MSIYKNIKQWFRLFALKKELKKNSDFFKNDYNYKATNVLIIDEIIPEFNKDSGSRRLTELIKLLLKSDVSVFLMANYKEYKYSSDYIQKFKELGVHVYEPLIFKDKVLTKEGFIKLTGSKMQYVWLHRPLIFNKFHEIVKAVNPDVKLIYDMVDFHYLRLEREYQENHDERIKKEADTFLEIELNNCKNADTIIAISKDDATFLLEYFPNNEKVKVISNIHEHLGKDNSFKLFEERKDVLFVGSFRHTPNKDAVKYLYEKIMPLIWSKLPNLKVHIVGSYQTEEILSFNSDRFIVHGFQEDIIPFFKSCRLFIAPLRYGAGIKGKIGQSLEHSLPLVTTAIGAEGFNFGDLKDKMVADKVEDFANNFIELYTNKIVWESVSNYSQTILEPFSLSYTEKQILSIIN